MNVGVFRSAVAPQPLPSKPRFRDDRPANIMTDRRVVRGSNFAPSSEDIDLARSQQRPANKLQSNRISEARRKSAAFDALEWEPRPVTPPPVDGRLHNETQTDVFIQDLRQHAMKCDAVEQTPEDLDVDLGSGFIPQSSGIDVATQLYIDEYQIAELPPGITDDRFYFSDRSLLMDFDAEVEPILHTLVDRCLRDALAEVVDEQEQSLIAHHQDRSASH